MLVLGTQLHNTPVMSLQTGAELARTKTPVIDPRTLSIVAYELEGPLLDEHPSLLRIADVRELSEIGMIVDSSDEFIGVDDVVKLKETYELHFPLIGLSVVDDKKHKLGKVEDYSVEIGGFIIQQLTVRRPILKSFGDTELLIHRSQIIEINDTTITVKAATNEVKDPIPTAAKAYVNPFRPAGSTQPEAIQADED
jgi:sporulation protein YlmC with PRC-barrel domain